MYRLIKTHVGNGLNNAIEVRALGEPGAGGACLEYLIIAGDGVSLQAWQSYIRFQRGNPAEGINGLSNESMLAVVRDRLEGFVNGPFGSPESSAALAHVIMAMECLQKRTAERIERGVEGQAVA